MRCLDTEGLPWRFLHSSLATPSDWVWGQTVLQVSSAFEHHPSTNPSANSKNHLKTLHFD